MVGAQAAGVPILPGLLPGVRGPGGEIEEMNRGAEIYAAEQAVVVAAKQWELSNTVLYGKSYRAARSLVNAVRHLRELEAWGIRALHKRGERQKRAIR